MSRPRFLVIDEGILPDWRPLPSVAEISVLPSPGEADRFQAAGACSEADLETTLDIAQAHSGRFDYILAECTEAFLWHCLFRLVGDQTPFVIVPRFNCIHAKNAYALLLSSQLGGPQDTIFCGSHAASQAFGVFGLRCSPLFLPGIDLDRFRPLAARRAEIRASLGVHRDRDLLLYMGRMADDKNVLELLQAVQIVRESHDVELVLCFRFPREEYLSRCREAGESMGGVRFIEDPDKRTIVQWYNAADLFVSAAVSIFETFGRAPVEAMACGTPPIVPAYNGFRETVTRRSGFLVPTTSIGYRKWPDVHLFAEAVLGALEDRRGLERKSRAGRARARRFERGRSVRAMLDELEGNRQSPDGSNRPSDQLRLDRYPAEVAELWAPLEGENLEDLVIDFLISGKVPIRPPDLAVRNSYFSWFSHY